MSKTQKIMDLDTGFCVPLSVNSGSTALFAAGSSFIHSDACMINRVGDSISVIRFLFAESCHNTGKPFGLFLFLSFQH